MGNFWLSEQQMLAGVPTFVSSSGLQRAPSPSPPSPPPPPPISLSVVPQHDAPANVTDRLYSRRRRHETQRENVGRCIIHQRERERSRSGCRCSPSGSAANARSVPPKFAFAFCVCSCQIFPNLGCERAAALQPVFCLLSRPLNCRGSITGAPARGEFWPAAQRGL